MNLSAAFAPVLSSQWLAMEPLRIGSVPPGLGTADGFALAEADGEPLLRVDLYSSSEESYAFEAALAWSSFLAIGWGNHFYLVEPETRRVASLDLGSYFGQFFDAGSHLLVASAERLFCIAKDGSLLWRSRVVGVDGVVVEVVQEGVIGGQGEWDPPGGWRSFELLLETGLSPPA